MAFSYQIDFSISCLNMKIASTVDLFCQKPCCSSHKVIWLLIFCDRIFVSSLSIESNRVIPLQFAASLFTSLFINRYGYARFPFCRCFSLVSDFLEQLGDFLLDLRASVFDKFVAMSSMLGGFLVFDLSIACFTSSMVISVLSFSKVSMMLLFSSSSPSSRHSSVLYRFLKCFSHVSIVTLLICTSSITSFPFSEHFPYFLLSTIEIVFHFFGEAFPIVLFQQMNAVICSVPYLLIKLLSIS